MGAVFQIGAPDTQSAKRPDTVAVLDIGACKTVCLIGQEEPNFGVRLLGTGFGVSGGLKGGSIVDREATEVGIRSAVEKAERAAGVTVQSVSVNVSSASLISRHLNLQTDFASGEVTEREQKRLVRSAFAKLASPHHAVLHALPLAWSVDAAQGIRDPLGMYGRTLGVDMHFVMADLGALRNLAHCIERCHLRIHSVTASPYAAGQGVLTDDELDLGCTLIDLGASVTTVAIFREGALLSTTAIPVGGTTLTSDIARGLNTPVEAAERIKGIYGSALLGADDHEVMVPCPPMGADDELTHEPRSQLTQIVRARMEETFELIADRLQRSGLEPFSGRRVVLTGGGARLTGVRELAALVFEKQVRVGKPTYMQGLKSSLGQPDFAVATGLLRAAFADDGDRIGGAPDLSGRLQADMGAPAGVVGRTARWLRENF